LKRNYIWGYANKRLDTTVLDNQLSASRSGRPLPCRKIPAEAESIPGPSEAGRVRYIEKSNNLSGIETFRLVP
jgi:hypothetical protein